jgi:hypothetical protein
VSLALELAALDAFIEVLLALAAADPLVFPKTMTLPASAHQPLTDKVSWAYFTAQRHY